ncbi:hypothetical protein M514_02545 [Trichuris suis]|uniref:Uncharacterized protein n=1 Tax=Trichuris suis TaxID=68888 RepID=A0A085MGU5_9BILA|nr:hypothetical protein M513_02545 [Trichuris suis]KFD70970.1 hypothetical protein M514_02545 [Trichuris suis]
MLTKAFPTGPQFTNSVEVIKPKVETPNGRNVEWSEDRTVETSKGRNTGSHVTEWSKYRMVKIPKVRTQIRNLEGTNDYLISEADSALYSLY